MPFIADKDVFKFVDGKTYVLKKTLKVNGGRFTKGSQLKLSHIGSERNDVYYKFVDPSNQFKDDIYLDPDVAKNIFKEKE